MSMCPTFLKRDMGQGFADYYSQRKFLLVQNVVVLVYCRCTETTLDFSFAVDLGMWENPENLCQKMIPKSRLF